MPNRLDGLLQDLISTRGELAALATRVDALSAGKEIDINPLGEILKRLNRIEARLDGRDLPSGDPDEPVDMFGEIERRLDALENPKPKPTTLRKTKGTEDLFAQQNYTLPT